MKSFLNFELGKKKIVIVEALLFMNTYMFIIINNRDPSVLLLDFPIKCPLWLSQNQKLTINENKITSTQKMNPNKNVKKYKY